MGLTKHVDERPSTIRTITYDGTCDCCGTWVEIGNRPHIFAPNMDEPYYCYDCIKSLQQFMVMLESNELIGARVIRITPDAEGREILEVQIRSDSGREWILTPKTEEI